MDILTAGVIYVLMRKGYCISRSERIHWYLQQLNSTIRITDITGMEEQDQPEMVVVSVVPRETPENWNPELRQSYEYLVTLGSNVIFLGDVYSFVFCLDISPSVAGVDMQHGEVLIELIITALKSCVEALVRPMIIPGCDTKFVPDVFITVIAHTPFYITPAQQVLVQGWKLTQGNLTKFLGAIQRQFEFMEKAVADVSSSVYEQLEIEKAKPNVSVKLENICEDGAEKQFQISFAPPNIAMTSPGSGLINLLRYGMLGLKLLPESNFSTLVVVTDGMIIMPDMDTLDSVLNHMRYNDISCSFIHVGSQFHPDCGLGFVPYPEIMQLICASTNGSYLQFPMNTKLGNPLLIFQRKLLVWSLKRKPVSAELSTPCLKKGDWNTMNRHFYGNRSPQLITRKHLESDINVSLLTILSCRIREGFIINDIQLKDNQLRIMFVLPWTNHIYVEYVISCWWPVSTTMTTLFHCSLIIKCPYEFIHDVSCRYRTPIRSPYRHILISRFWNSLKSFAQSDALLSHLESFMHNYASYYLPESVRGGNPLYYFPSNTSHPTLISNDLVYTEFTQAWRPVCFLDHNLWPKWFHTNRIGVILKHDEPVLCSAAWRKTNDENESRNFQCREAVATLLSFIKSRTSFVLIENHSYVRFLSPTELGTGKYSFYIAKVISKPPYAVIHLAFLYNIPEKNRHKLLKELKHGIKCLQIPRLCSSIVVEALTNYNLDDKCCVMIEKPLEKLLIRYEHMPDDFRTIVFPDGTQPSKSPSVRISSSNGLLCTLSRYLQHRRWIWSTHTNDFHISRELVENALATLIRVRLKEGFHFSHCSSGVTNMVLEVRMKSEEDTRNDSDSDDANDEDNLHHFDHSETDECDGDYQTCIIQYILFPLYFKNKSRKGKQRKSTPSIQENDAECIEIVSECWIEPQHGFITACPSKRYYMSNLQYHQLPDAIWNVDAECISVLFTFEYLKLFCEDIVVNEQPPSIQGLLSQRYSLQYWPYTAPFADQRIKEVPFAYSIATLCFKCQRQFVELTLFSQDVLDYSPSNTEPNRLLLDSMYNYMKHFHTKEIMFPEDECLYFLHKIKKNIKRSGAASESSSSSIRKNPSYNEFSTASDTLPSGRDWARLIAWAVDGSDYKNDDEDLDLDYNGNIDDTFDVLSDTNISTSSDASTQKRKLSSDANDVFACAKEVKKNEKRRDNDQLKWKCYIKFLSRTHCIITLVPSSYDTIKSLVLEQDYYKSESSKISEFDDNTRDISSPDPNEKNSVYDSSSTTAGFISEIELPIDNQAESEYFSGDEKKDTNNFRARASTWDSSKQRQTWLDCIGSFRLRANSLGARCDPLFLLKPKPRLEDVSYNNKCASPSITSERTLKQTKFVTISLPVYVFNCPIDNVFSTLINKFDHLNDNDLKYTLEQEFGQDGIRNERLNTYYKEYRHNLTKNRDTEIRESKLEENEYFDNQCNRISMAFDRSYVVSLFKSLHLGYEVSSADVKSAFEKCDESLLAIDITGYLKIVCNHVRNYGEEAKESETNSWNATTCNDFGTVHKLIKRRFMKVLNADFKSIPSEPQCYYCSPCWAKESKSESLGPLSPTAIESSSTVSTPEHHGHSAALSYIPELKPWELRRGSENSEEDACTSLLSNMDSDSSNDGAVDGNLLDDVYPLFMHFVCHISSSKFQKSSPVDVVPTCICEILKGVDKFLDQTDLDDFRVILDVHCLTLPLSELIAEPLKTSDTNKQDVLPRKSYEFYPNSPKNVSFEEGNVPKEILNLPDYQYHALSAFITQMEWLMKDEVVTFLLKVWPVTLETLQLVCDHIFTSPSETCSFVEKVPLVFVLGSDLSSHQFLQDFALMKIPAYRLNKEDDFYYIVRDSDWQSASDVQDSSTGNDSSYVSANSSSSLNQIEDFMLDQESENMEVYYDAGSSSPTNKYAGDNLDEKIKSAESGGITHKESNNKLNNITNNDPSEGEDIKPIEATFQLPNFWLVLRVGKDHVMVYFHCRYSDTNKKNVKDYIIVRETVINNIKDRCKLINQNMLLQSLYETRFCDRLLEPDSEPDYIKGTYEQNVNEEASEDDDDKPFISLDLSHKFMPGYFACNVVWETDFPLHPRLRTGQVKCTVSRGIQAMCSVLSRFAVNNRKNLFVYRDSGGNVFYLRLYEYIYSSKYQDIDDASPASFSRSSSFTSLNRKTLDDQLSFMPEDFRGRNKSLCGSLSDYSSFKVDHLTLRVHGIVNVGHEIRHDLVQVLQNRLDDAVLEVISIMLCRNPHCKLMQDDVLFLQKPNRPPSYKLRFNILRLDRNYIRPFAYYLRKNIVYIATSPKYSDPKSSVHFQDYSEPEYSPQRISENDIYLYNQTPSSGKGVACIALAVFDEGEKLIEHFSEIDCISPLTTTETFDLSFEDLKQMTDATIVSSDTETISGEGIIIEFRVWEQGRVNIELLGYKFNLTIRHALWESIMDFKILPYPLLTNRSDEDVILSPLYHINLPQWLVFGNEILVPSVKVISVPITVKDNFNIILKELNSAIFSHKTACYLFISKKSDDVVECSDSYVPFVDHNNTDELHLNDTCIIIARNINFRKFLSLESTQNQEHKRTLGLLNDDDQQCYRFLLITIKNMKIDLHFYNWSKDMIQTLSKLVNGLSSWISARSDFLLGIVQQKLGLFHHLSFQRNFERNSAFGQLTAENLLNFSNFGTRSRSSPQISQLFNTLRDSRVITPMKKEMLKDDIFAWNAEQMTEQHKFDKRGRQRYLYNMWQSRRCLQNTALTEDVLTSFLSDSRLIHYCMTPLLFLPKWRIEAAATRDHSLSLKTQSQLSGDDQILVENVNVNMWHMTVCSNFVQEYKQYLQSLGFVPIYTIYRKTNSQLLAKKEKELCYLQKSLLGGILLFEIFLAEPFFNAKLYSLEYSRLKSKTTNPVVSQFAISFLDECDRIKSQMHLHSFTYDYHLRSVHLFVTEKKSSLKDGYHITSFFDDFLKYYAKAPNYARNLLFSDSVHLKNLEILPPRLFDYLLSHGKKYDVQPFSMKPADDPDTTTNDREYVLIQKKSTPFIYYRDLNDMKQTDDFDVTIIISNTEIQHEQEFSVQFYILITSRRELYPKIEIEKKLGKFRTVSTSIPKSSDSDLPDDNDQCDSSTDSETATEPLQDIVDGRKKPLFSNIEIKQESVNYLGYYSTHEEVMQNLMMNLVTDVKKHIEWMVVQGAFDCVTEALWNRLLSCAPAPLTYEELQSLLSYAEVFVLNESDSALNSLLNKSPTFINNMAKIITTKYEDCCRMFLSPDGAAQHILVVHPRHSCGLVMFTIDSCKSKCTLNLVCRKGPEFKDDMEEIKKMLSQIVNSCCCQLWLDALNSKSS